MCQRLTNQDAKQLDRPSSPPAGRQRVNADILV
jgi:hypothetical protein